MVEAHREGNEQEPEKKGWTEEGQKWRRSVRHLLEERRRVHDTAKTPGTEETCTAADAGSGKTGGGSYAPSIPKSSP